MGWFNRISLCRFLLFRHFLGRRTLALDNETQYNNDNNYNNNNNRINDSKWTVNCVWPKQGHFYLILHKVNWTKRNLQPVTHSDCPWQPHVLCRRFLTATPPTSSIPKITRGVGLLGLSSQPQHWWAPAQCELTETWGRWWEERRVTVMSFAWRPVGPSQTKPHCSHCDLWQQASF